MTQEKAFEYHESNLNNMGYDVDWTRGMGWDV